MLPKDPIILLSVVNTRLRDLYSNLQELCAAEDADPEEVPVTGMTRHRINLYRNKPYKRMIGKIFHSFYALKTRRGVAFSGFSCQNL